MSISLSLSLCLSRMFLRAWVVKGQRDIFYDTHFRLRPTKLIGITDLYLNKLSRVLFKALRTGGVI